MKYILLSLLIITLSSCLTTKSTKLNPYKDLIAINNHELITLGEMPLINHRYNTL